MRWEPYRIDDDSPVAQSTNRYTRAGQAAFKLMRELVPGLDVDTIKGMLRNESPVWEKAQTLLNKANVRRKGSRP